MARHSLDSARSLVGESSTETAVTHGIHERHLTVMAYAVISFACLRKKCMIRRGTVNPLRGILGMVSGMEWNGTVVRID